MDKKEQPTPWKEIFIQFRGRISVMILLIGLALFLLQLTTTGSYTKPDKTFSLLLLQDFSARNAFLNDLPEDAELSVADVPKVDSHYFGEPQEGFDQRFSAWAEKLPESESLTRIPLTLRIMTISDENAQVPLAYWVIQMTPDYANILLPDTINTADVISGRQFIGPHLYDTPPLNDDLQRIAGDFLMEETPRLLSPSSSALQGFVIQVVNKVSPNGFLLLPAGSMTVGDYAVNVNEYSQQMAINFQKSLDAGETPEVVPSFRFSDIRHDSLIYFAVLLGQMLFMAGGFLLCYHFIENYANADHQRSNFIKNAFIDSCCLIRDHKGLYALTILFFMLFWGYGLVVAHVDPASQEEMVVTYQTMFSASSWPLGFTGETFQRGDVLFSTGITLVLVFFWGTVVILSIFSLLPIGSAFIINALRGQAIGLIIAPTKAFFGLKMVPHLLTVLLELQAYLIAGFVAVLLPLAMIRPKRFGCENPMQAFWKFAMWQFKVLPLVGLILIFAAVYQVLEIFLLNQFF